MSTQTVVKASAARYTSTVLAYRLYTHMYSDMVTAEGGKRSQMGRCSDKQRRNAQNSHGHTQAVQMKAG